MCDLISKIQHYIDVYETIPTGREVEGTVELLEECRNALKQQPPKKTVYLLICACSRLITTMQFATKKEAWEAMRRSIVCYGNAPESILTSDEYDGDACGFGSESGFVQTGPNGHEYSWRIISVEI